MARRRRRWLRRALATVGLLLLVAVVAVVVLLRSLDRPWLKRRVQALAHARTGLDVDWTATHVGLLSGLRVDTLIVQTPPPLRAEAAELLRLDGLEIDWTGRSLVAGTPRFLALRVESLALTLVRDVDGRSSLSTIEPHGSGTKSPSPPPSRAAADALDGPPPIGRIDVAHASITILAQAPHAPRERLRVDGLSLHATLSREGRGFTVAASLGAPEAPLALTIVRTRDGAAAGEARARLWIDVRAAAASASARADVEVVSQTLSPSAPVGKVAHVEASARFGEGAVALTVANARIGDGAATVAGRIDVPDAAPMRIDHAEGAIDLPRLLALVPSSLVPVEAEHARLRYRVHHLLVSAAPRLDADGSASIEGEIGRVRILRPQANGNGDGNGNGNGDVVIDGGALSATAKPDAGATKLHATLPLASLTTHDVAAEKLLAILDARVGADGAIAGDATVRYGGVRVAGPTRIAARDGELGAHVAELRVNASLPLATRGTVTLSARAATLDVTDAATRATADQIAATVRATLRGEPPYAVDVEMPAARLRVSSAGRTLVDGPVRVAMHATDVRPDALHARRTRARVHADVAVGALTAALDADKQPDAIDFKVRADAASLALVQPLLPRGASWSAPWDKMSLTLASDGRLESFATPSLREHTTLAVTHAAVTGAGGTLAADRLEVTAASNGSVAKHEVTVELRTRALRVAGEPQGDTTLTSRWSYDLRAPSAHVKVATVGDKGIALALDAALGFDRARRAVTYDVDARLARLASLAPLTHGGLSGFDFDTLALELQAQGSLAGLAHDVDPRGRVRLEKEPLRTLAADGTVDVAVSGLDWSRGDRELAVPHARWHAVLATSGEKRLVHGTLTVDSLTLDAGDHELVLRDVTDEIDGSIAGDLRAGVGELNHRLLIKKVSQDLLAAYRLGDVALDIKAHRDADGVIHVAELLLGNRVAGTTLKLHGGIDVGAERRSLSLQGELTQDLSRAWYAPAVMQGRGSASVQLRVDSGNLRVYHALAAVRIAGGTIALPGAGVTVESIDGEIPLTADLVFDAKGMHLLRSTNINAYSELRFADQHPLLGHPSFVSIGRVVTPMVTLTKLAGNLRLVDNIVSLSQLELGVRGGRVTGQCIIDWREDDSTVQLRVRASEVASSHGERFDGNAAVVLTTRERSVDGRAEILRIGKRHLYDLLDLDDPHRTDPAVNRVRRALALGYPDRVRLSFKHGFADARITFGGLARLIKVDELHGIPMGPIIDKIMAPLEHKQGEDE